MLRHIIHFEGRVQGVGFRATTQRIAQDFAVAGFVRNLADGRVQVYAEGESDELDRFTEAVLKRMARNITRHTANDSPATGEFGRSFEIRF